MLSAALVVLGARPILGQPVDDDEETSVVRRPPHDDDEETSVVRRPVGDDDEETSLVRRPAQDDDDGEGTTLVRRPRENSTSLNGSSRPQFYSSRFQGYFYEKMAFDTVHDGDHEDVFDIRTRLGLLAEVTSPGQVKLHLDARFSHFAVGEDAGTDTWYFANSKSVKYEYEAELREAYVYVPNEILNFRVGNQIVRWGYGELNKPSDVLNPTDFREGLFNDLETPLIPVFMAQVDRSFGPVNLSAVWIPFFRPNRTNMFGQDWAPMSAMYGNQHYASLEGISGMYEMVGGLVSPLLEDRIQPIMMATHPPEESIENGQWGAKADLSFRGVDVQLCYLYGWDKMPWFQVDQQFLGNIGTIQGVVAQHPAVLGVLQGMTSLDPFDPMAGAGRIMGALGDLDDEEKAALQEAMQAMGNILFDEAGSPRELALEDIFSTSYRRQQTIGASLSTVLFDTVGLKMDSAFSPRRTVFLETAAGFPEPAGKPAFSYSIGLDYRLGSWFDILGEFYHFHVFDLAPGEEVFIIGSDMYMVTVASHFRFLEFDALEFQLAGMMELSMANLFLIPKVSYKLTDNGRVAVGALLAEILPGGDEMGPAGLYDRNDALYVDLKWSF